MYSLTEVGIFKAYFSPIKQVPAAGTEGCAGVDPAVPSFAML